MHRGCRPPYSDGTLQPNSQERPSARSGLGHPHHELAEVASFE